MGRRHALNNTAKSYFTSWEKKEAGYGTKSERIGTDSKLPFGHCCLGLGVAVDPVVSPSGHMYSKEAIYEYLLAKQEELSKARKAWKRQQEESIVEKQGENAKKEAETIQKFIKNEERVSRKRKADDFEAQKKAFQFQAHKVGEVIRDPSTKKDRLKELKRTSFWLPDFTPDAVVQKIKEPRKRPGSPMTNRPLRLKDLAPIKLTEMEPENKSDEKKFCCQVSQKQITFQNTVFIKSTGAVMLEACYKEFAKPTMTCPVTNKKFKKKHAILMKSDGSGFASSGNVIAKKWGESLMN